MTAALILAGSRTGVRDPVALGEGVAHKALAIVGGETLLARVAGALPGTVAVSANDPAVIAEAERLGLRVLPPATGPSASVAAALAELCTPLVVTTADHALLRPEWVAALIAGTPPGADVSVMLAERDRVEADRKRPWRIVARLGPGLLLRFLLGRLTLADAVATLGRKAGIVAAVVPAPNGLAAVDVDTPADLALVRSLV